MVAGVDSVVRVVDERPVDGVSGFRAVTVDVCAGAVVDHELTVRWDTPGDDEVAVSEDAVGPGEAGGFVGHHGHRKAIALDWA